MRRRGLFLALLIGGASVSRAEILTLWSDNGVSSTTIGTYIAYQDPALLGYVGYNGLATDIASPEGYSNWKTTATLVRPNTYVGWGLQYNTPQDLSRFDNGELRFWVNTDVDLMIEVADGTSAGNSTGDRIQTYLSANGWTSAMANKWVQIRLSIAPLMAYDLAHGGTGKLNNITAPFLFTALSSPATFYIDDVRYVDSTTSPIFNVALLNRSNNTPASAIDWGNLSLAGPVGWTMAPQYLQLTVDADMYPWGVQIYTNNTAAGASPQFQTQAAPGKPGSNPAGLVEVSSTSVTLPLAWAVKADTTTAPVAADPNGIRSDSNSYQWFYVADKATPAISVSSTTAFANGDLYIAVKNNIGIHFAQGDALGATVGPGVFGAANPPNAIYFETNLAGAISPNTYKTTTLTVEFYTP